MSNLKNTLENFANLPTERERYTDKYKDRWKWRQNPNSSLYNDGGYVVQCVNGDWVGVGDCVKVKFSNGTFTCRVKQTAGFGWNENRPVICVLAGNKLRGTKVHIDNVLSKA